jgi:hypothetical protein
MAKKTPAKKKLGGPYLAAAFFCDAVIEDKSDVLSAFRIIDTINLALPELPDFPTEKNRVPVHISGILSFKTGDSPGKHILRVVMTSPSGKKNPAFEREITLTEVEHGGANVVMRHTINIVKGGVFWFSVYLDDKLYTRIPLNIVIHKIETTPPKSDSATSSP